MSTLKNQNAVTVLCRSEDLPDLSSRAFGILWQGGMEEMFVIRRYGQLFGYLNRCPHTGGPLDWSPNVFLDLDKRYIQCATHDALFAIEDGRCLIGPCVGDSLIPIPVHEQDGLIVLNGSLPTGMD